jgi:uroporphyrin-III C-methyltransferase / precorrin-2 dehydrogenase / sirohydrochlorin ferrochelatase
MGYFPLFLGLEHKTVLIIGGGRIALSKLQVIFEYTQNITLVAVSFDDLLVNFARDNDIKIIQDEYKSKYLANFDIIISATDNFYLNQNIAKDSKRLGKLINIVDNPKISDFIFGAIIKRGNINIAISTSGLSPVLARLIKQEIEKILPTNIELLNEFIKANRDLVKNRLTNIQARRLFWQEIFEGSIGQEIADGNYINAQSLLDEKLSSNNNKIKSALYLIGAGAGDPELITVKAINLLSKADIVLYDRLIAPQILEYIRKDAIKINVGKTKDFHKFSQTQINNLIKQYLKEGNIVARLKGGDPSIFAHLYEEVDVAKQLNIPYQIVPGISAASGASSYSSIPLTARNIADSVRFLTLYKKDKLNKEYWQDLVKTKDTLVFYMASSNAEFIAKSLISNGRDPSTSIAVIEQATTPYQKTYISNLVEFKQQKFISPSLIIVGEVVKFAKQYKYKEESQSGEYFNKLTK